MKFISICLLQYLLYLCTGGLLHIHLNALYIYTMIYVANKSEFEKKCWKRITWSLFILIILYIKSMVSSQESCVQCILTNTSQGRSLSRIFTRSHKSSRVRNTFFSLRWSLHSFYNTHCVLSNMMLDNGMNV